MTPGDLLRIIGDDPVFEVAVRDYCLANEHEVLSVSRTADDEVCIRIRV